MSDTVGVDDWLQLLVNGVLGAFCGAAASLFVATRIARGSELGRTQEETRQRIVSSVRLYRARVKAALDGTSSRSAQAKDYTSAAAACEFAESIERSLIHLPQSVAEEVRGHVVTLVGPVTVERAQVIAFLPAEERGTDWDALTFLRAAETVGHEQVEDSGLLGRVRDSAPHADGGDAAIAELDAMEATLNRWRVTSVWR